MDKTKKIGFIGTGVMGAGMAANLLRGGYRVSVYNRTREKALPLVEQGAVLCESVAALAAASDIIITMVGYPADVQDVYLAPTGVLASALRGTTVIDMTTSKPSLAKRIAQEAEKRGIAALDAPVSGGDVGAAKGTLAIMVGGDAAAFEAMRPVFACMGQNIVRQGGPGAGQHTKMCNQIAIAAAIMGVCESFAYAEKAGLDPETVLQCIASGGAGSWQMNAYVPRILKGDFEPGFYIKHFVKDMGIALEEAQAMGLDTPALALAKSLYDRLLKAGNGDRGTQFLYTLYSDTHGGGQSAADKA